MAEKRLDPIISSRLVLELREGIWLLLGGRVVGEEEEEVEVVVVVEETFNAGLGGFLRGPSNALVVSWVGRLGGLVWEAKPGGMIVLVLA